MCVCGKAMLLTACILPTLLPCPQLSPFASGALLWPPSHPSEDSLVPGGSSCAGTKGLYHNKLQHSPMMDPGSLRCVWQQRENGRRVLGDLSPRLKTIDSKSRSTMSNDCQQKASVTFTLGKGWWCLALLGCSAVCRTHFTRWVWLANQPREAESGW